MGLKTEFFLFKEVTLFSSIYLPLSNFVAVKTEIKCKIHGVISANNFMTKNWKLYEAA